MNRLRLLILLAFFMSSIDAQAQSPFAPSFTSFEENELELDSTAGIDCCDYYAVRRCELNAMATEPQLNCSQRHRHLVLVQYQAMTYVSPFRRRLKP